LLAPAHAHFILLGYVAMFLSALYYRTVPEAAASQLAPVQAVVSVIGAILFPIGIACVRLGDRGRFMPVLVAGWLAVLTGMLLFAVIVYRSSGHAPVRQPLNDLEGPAPSAEKFENFIFPSPVGK
jgi:hypothetical protein